MNERIQSYEPIMLFLSSFAVLFIGFGLFPVLPIISSQFGADRVVVGIFLAVLSIANAIGAVMVGLLSGKITRKTLFVGSALLGVPALVLLSQATAFWQVVLLSSIVWWSGGVILTLVNIILSLVVAEKNRSKAFSILALSIPLSSLAGGATISWVLSRSGYPQMFAVLSGVWATIPIIGLALREKNLHQTDSVAEKDSARSKPHEESVRTFAYVLLVMLFSAMAISISRLGVPMVMQSQNFSGAQVASSATISGLVTLPVLLLLGWTSGRISPRNLLVLINLAVAGGILVLSRATELWQYWLASSVMMVGFSVNGSQMSVLVAETVEGKSLNRSLSWISTTSSTASVLSFAGMGFIMENFGEGVLFAIATLLAVLAALRLYTLPGKRLMVRRFISFKRQSIIKACNDQIASLNQVASQNAGCS